MSQQGYTNDIVRLIEQQGNQAAAAADRRGQIWGGALANLGQIPQHVAQLDIQRKQRENLANETALRAQQVGLEVDKAKRQESDRQATTTALQNSGGDLEKAIPAIMQTNPEAALKLQDALNAQKRADLQGKSALLDYHSKINNTIADALGPVADEADPVKQQAVLDSAHATLKKLGIPTDDLPTQAGPEAAAKAAALRQGTMSAKEQLAAKQKALEDQIKALEQASKEKDRIADNARQAEKDKAEAATRATVAAAATKQAEAAMIRAKRPPAAADSLQRVEHKDPATGRTVIEFLPKSEVRGKTFEKGTGAVTENRLASAQAVNQVGNDMIAKLSDPAFVNAVGPIMGRSGKLRDLIGNPPPEFAELAGEIESYALATMGVHGMRSTVGAEKVAQLLDAHHTPESLVATLKGLNSFANNLMKNEGRTPPGQESTTPKVNPFRK